MNYINEEHFVRIDQEYIDFQKPIYNDIYITDVKVGDWVYDDGEVLVGMSCIYQWYSTSVGEEQENYRQIYDHLEALNKRD